MAGGPLHITAIPRQLRIEKRNGSLGCRVTRLFGFGWSHPADSSTELLDSTLNPVLLRSKCKILVAKLPNELLCVMCM